MPRKQPQFAKLSRPRLHKAVARERLFALLDDAREHNPGICVVGPPGAGKTTLVASWLDARNIKGIWYQIDPGDSDLATFFYYLGEAVRPFTRKPKHRLPLFTPEYLQDVDGFSRRFFRDLFSRLPEGAALVLDNYQEVPADHQFHALIAGAIEEVPAGMAIFVMSRRDPPQCYARLIANASVTCVDWDALRFTLEEASAMAATRNCLSVDAMRRLHDQSDGWAAGLTLLIEGGSSPRATHREGPAGAEALFAYFAGQIFNQVSRSTQEFLVITAYLSQVPVSFAVELTGNASAAEILDELYRRHLFTHRRLSTEPVYWYHALFREFLLSRASGLLEVEMIRDVKRRAARMLETRDNLEEAFHLYCAATDWDSAADLTTSSAEAMLARGRNQTLRDWIRALPENLLVERPSLNYWLGLSLVQTDPRDARHHLELAVKTIDDPYGKSLSVAAIIDSYFYEWSDFRPVRPWLDTLEVLVHRIQTAGRPGAAVKLHASLLVGMLYAAPDHPFLPRAVQKVAESLNADADANSMMSTGIILLSYCNLSGDMELGRKVVARCAQLVGRVDLTPLNELWWQLRLGYHHELSGRYEDARAALDRAVEVCEAHGFRGLNGTFLLIASYQLSTAASSGRNEDARMWYERMIAMADPHRPMDAWHLDESRVHIESLNGNYRAVAEIGEQALERTAAAGMTYIEVLTIVNWGIGRAMLGDEASLKEAMTRLRHLTEKTCFSYLECAARLTESRLALKQGRRQQGLSLLADALKLARSQRFTYPQIVRFASIVPELFAEALRAGIESDYVVDTIQRLQIRAPGNAPASWPWPLRINALGGFEVWRDGQRLNFSGKVPRKPLALLKVLIAYGGRDVPEYRITDALWPGEDADLAAKKFDVTLVRLRKLLCLPESVIVSDGVLNLNPDLFWIDVWAFESAANDAIGSILDSGTSATGHDAIDLYRGEFLPADVAQPWALRKRERLRSIFLRTVEWVGKRLEAAQQWERAIECYERGLDSDDLAEPLYQGLMRCYRVLDRRAEAMNAYRRLRRLLSVVLGMAPSEATQALARTLQAESPAGSA